MATVVGIILPYSLLNRSQYTSLESALKRMLKVHQRWKAVTEILQVRRASQASQSSPSSSIENEALESFMRQTIKTLLSIEVTVSKEDAEALIEMIGVYGQGFLFGK